MAEWLYRATGSKAVLEATQSLARDEGFICRTGFRARGSGQARTGSIDHVFEVRVGDVIHLYWVDRETAASIGSFEVISPAQHAAPHRFGMAVHASALVRVMDGAFREQLEAVGAYDLDPNIKLFTGWPVRASTSEAPSFDADRFSRQGAIALWR